MTEYTIHLSTCVDFYPDEFMPVIRAIQRYIDADPCGKDTVVLEPFLNDLKDKALEYAQ